MNKESYQGIILLVIIVAALFVWYSKPSGIKNDIIVPVFNRPVIQNVEIEQLKSLLASEIPSESTTPRNFFKPPFYHIPSAPAALPQRPTDPELSSLRVSGILFNHGQGAVIINDEIYSVGEQAHGYTVQAVHPGKVILQGSGNSYSLGLQ